MKTHLNSQSQFKRATAHIPGGVNSPVRAFKGVGGEPIFFERANGAYLYDVDGNAYVDCVGSWGPMILGHNHPKVREAVIQAAEAGLSFGAPCPLEVKMAETLCTLLPNIESVRMVNSGTEATMSALRLSRAYTGRPYFIKFEGCYHGHGDAFLVKAGSGALTCGSPSSPGIPDSTTEYTLIATYNDFQSVLSLFKQYPQQIAAVIIEPVAGNMNCIPPLPGFLSEVALCCKQEGALLIFDEVMTGFRVALQGAQGLYGIKPDLTTLGKVIGGGMPVGAFGGRQDIMAHLAPQGAVYQAGTLSGNPVAMSAGLACLEQIQAPHFFEILNQRTQSLLQGLQERADHHKVNFMTQHVGSLFGLFFTNQAHVRDFSEATRCHVTHFKKFFHTMLEEGVYLAPSAYEAGFLSMAHEQTEIEKIWNAADVAFRGLAA